MRLIKTVDGEPHVYHKCYSCNLLIPDTQPDEEIYFHGNTKRSFKSIDNMNMVFSREILLNLIRAIEDLKDKAFLSALYLGAFRISEICDSNFFKFQINTEYLDSQGRKWFLFKQCLVLKGRSKNPDVERNDRPISYIHDQEFIEPIIEYINQLHREDPLFPFNRKTGWKRVSEYGIFPHLLRARRALDLANPKLYGWNLKQIQQFGGWKSLETINNYLKYTGIDLMEQTR